MNRWQRPHHRAALGRALHQGDADQARPRARRLRHAPSLDRRRLPRPHARPARAARRASTCACRRPAISRPARTTRPRTSASCSARRSTRRSATAAASRATATRRCRWTRRSAPARSTSAAGRTAPSRRSCRPTSIAGFDTELAEEFFRAVANNAKLTLHLRVLEGSNAHHMIEACFKAFARALREAVAVDESETGRPVDEGRAVSGAADRDPRLRHGQPALGREGARARRRRARRHARPRPRSAQADGVVLPGVGAFPKAMRNLRELGLDVLIGDRLSAGVPTLGICLGLQLLFESSSENEGAWGLGLLQGRVERLPAPGLKVPLIGWNAVRWSKQSRLTAELPDECPFYFVHSFAPVGVAEEDVLGTAEYGERVRLRGRARAALRRAVPPGEVERARPAAARELRRHLRRGRRSLLRARLEVDLYPAVDILGGKAVRLDAGRLRRARRSTRTIRSTPPALGRGRRAAAARGRPRRRARRAAGQPRRASSASRVCGVPVQYGGGLRSADAVEAAHRRRRDARRARHRGFPGPRRCSKRWSSAHGDRIAVGARRARAVGSRSRAGRSAPS